MADWEGLLALAQTQDWGEYYDQPQRKIAVERGRVRVPVTLGRHGRATGSRQYHRSILEGIDIAFEWVQWVNYMNVVEGLLFAFGKRPALLIRNEATGMYRQVVSTRDGSYFLAAITPGTYTVSAEMTGLA